MVGTDEKLTSKSKIDFSRLPPCKDNLIPQVARANYRVSSYTNADMNVVSGPTPCDAGQGWETNVSGVLEPAGRADQYFHLH